MKDAEIGDFYQQVEHQRLTFQRDPVRVDVIRGIPGGSGEGPTPSASMRAPWAICRVAEH